MGIFSKVRRWNSRGGVAALAVAAALSSAPAGAAAAEAAVSAADADDAGGLEEIIVTAQRRSENLQAVPIAVSAVTARALEESGVNNTNALPQLVPSVQFTRSGASGLFFVRGVGTTNAAVGEDGANAFYIDGVYSADLAQTINNFNNIERIEVLKGPQGTLFGRNAFGGLVSIITRDPGDELTVKGQLGYGNYETVSSQLYVAAPIGDKVGADFAWTSTNQNKGWGRNLTTNKDIHVQDYWGVRSKIVFQPSDAVKLKLAGDYYKNSDNLAMSNKIEPGPLPSTGGVFGPAGHDTTSDVNSLTQQKIWGVSLTGEIDLGFAELTSISAMRKNRNHTLFDGDSGPLPILSLEFVSTGKSYQQELRLASTGSGPLSWQLGAFYLRSEASNDSAFMGTSFPATLREQHILADLTTDSYAAFGEATYEVTPSTKLTAGVRYTADRRKFVGSSTNVLLNGNPLSVRSQDSRLNYNEVTYRLAVRQEIADDISAYATVNRGFKAGTYSLQSPLNAPAKPQYIMAYEAGLKSELFDRKLRLNLAAYHYDIDDLQVRSAAAAAPGTTILFNAATVKVDGFDAEFDAAPTDRLRLFGGFTALKSRYSKFGGEPLATTAQAPFIYPIFAGQTAATTCPAALRGTKNPGLTFPGTSTGGFFTCFGDASGLRTPLAPKLAASLGTSYKVPVGEAGEVRLSILYSYNSGYVYEADNFAREGDFQLVNASIEYRPNDNVAIELWGKNLGDKEYSVQKLSNNTGVKTVLAPPRTYGVNLKIEF